MKGLTEKLSAALVNVSAKEDLVTQHAKVAEEAVAGISFVVMFVHKSPVVHFFPPPPNHCTFHRTPHHHTTVPCDYFGLILICRAMVILF